MASAQRTIDHDTIERWASARGGKPAHVRRTGQQDDPGILRLDFPGYSGAGSLEPLDWDSWFDAFEANQLALIYQDNTADGRRSNFNKLVKRTPEDEHEGASAHTRGTRRKGRTAEQALDDPLARELDAYLKRELETQR